MRPLLSFSLLIDQTRRSGAMRNQIAEESLFKATSQD